MKPVSFDYYAPTSVEEALNTMADLGYDGKVLAGGQSLLAAMNFRLATPPALVDLNNIPELFYIRPQNDGGVAIGAMTRDSVVEFDPFVSKHFQLIKEVMPCLAHAQIRNRGTFGGNIAHADPTGHIPPIFVALKGRVLLRKKGGERWVDADDFFVGPFTSVLEPDELLTEVVLPPMPAHSGSSYKQVARQEGAAALVGVATIVTLDDKERCKEARMVYFSVQDVPVVAYNAAKVLVGQVLTEDVIRVAAETAAVEDVTDPSSDIHASADYRRQLVQTLGRRSLAEAYERARKNK